MCHILPKVQSKQDIIYNRYIPRGEDNIFFFGELSTGIDPASNFDLIKMYNDKYIYLKCNGNIEGVLSRKT